MTIEELRRLVQEGSDSGPGLSEEEVFEPLIAKYQAMIDADNDFSPTPRKTIHLATGLIVNPETKRALVVRKRGTLIFMQPGGKIEPGETAFAALQRELLEEIGLNVSTEDAEYLGSFTAPAANEAGHTVHSEAFYIETTAPVEKAAEIEDIRWIDPANPGDIALAPLSGGQLMPIMAARLARRG